MSLGEELLNFLKRKYMTKNDFFEKVRVLSLLLKLPDLSMAVCDKIIDYRKKVKELQVGLTDLIEQKEATTEDAILKIQKEWLSGQCDFEIEKISLNSLPKIEKNILVAPSLYWFEIKADLVGLDLIG